MRTRTYHGLVKGQEKGTLSEAEGKMWKCPRQVSELFRFVRGLRRKRASYPTGSSPHLRETCPGWRGEGSTGERPPRRDSDGSGRSRERSSQGPQGRTAPSTGPARRSEQGRPAPEARPNTDTRPEHPAQGVGPVASRQPSRPHREKKSCPFNCELTTQKDWTSKI